MKHIGADVVLLHLLHSLSPPAVALILGADQPSSPGGCDGRNADQAPVQTVQAEQMSANIARFSQGIL